MIKKTALIFLLTLTLTPVFVSAQATQAVTAAGTPAPKLDYSGFVKCDGVVTDSEPDRKKECDFNALLDTVKQAINWLFVMTIPLVTALFAYAGYLYMTGSQKNIGTAKSIFTSAATGFIIMLVAWFAVVTVVGWFVTPTTADVVKTFVNTK